MPTELQKHPDKNVTFTQFFTKLLIKVPQVDIEKLPSHLLGDMVSNLSNDDLEFLDKKNEEDDELSEEEKGIDIYSFEHVENIEEFRPKGIIS